MQASPTREATLASVQRAIRTPDIDADAGNTVQAKAAESRRAVAARAGEKLRGGKGGPGHSKEREASPAEKEKAAGRKGKKKKARKDPGKAKAQPGGAGGGGRGRAGKKAPTQMKGRGGGDVHAAAAHGIQGSGGALPHLAPIQKSFGRHDVSGVQAHVGGPASEASRAMGAQAYATGNHVAFDGAPSLHTAAHEAAHVVQQREGVQLAGGVGKAGDVYEKHADAVADKVVAGESAETLLDQHAGGGGEAAVQKACKGAGDCECPKCAKGAQGATPPKPAPVESAAAEAERTTPVQRSPATDVVQFDLLDDAIAAGQDLVDRGSELLDDAIDAGRELVNDVIEWIDLLGPKTALFDKIVNGQWIIDEVQAVEGANTAHPDHDFSMKLELYGVGLGAAVESGGFALRIADCDDLAAVEALGTEFDEWKSARGPTLNEELEAKVEEYRTIERSWLERFSNTTVCQDPVNPNKSDQSVALCLQGGAPEALVEVETRVNCTYGRTALAQADSDGDGNPDVADWTDEEKTEFMTKFQQQLDHVWTTGAGQTAPFRCSAPQDFLLSTESSKWSAITAKMKATVTADSSNPHFNINVLKRAAGEGGRAGVNYDHTNNIGTATFYQANADAGYHTSGPDAGNPNGRQMTLAHEWHHMIGNPDEYAENSRSQSNSSSTPAGLQNRWTVCQQHFQDIIDDETKPQAERDQAAADLDAITNQYQDSDPSTAGSQDKIYSFAGRSDVPEECFAIRGTWTGPDSVRLQPGRSEQRGGLRISQSAEDAARLSDSGMQVRPYMREGIVEELKSMLEGVFSPEVSFDHNFQDMSEQDIVETITVRVNNIMHDIPRSMGSEKAPADQVPHEHDHDHGHGGHGDHDGHDH